MRGDRDDRQYRDSVSPLESVRPIEEEDAVSPGRVVLNIGLENVFAVRAVE
jgi:hypothetical protein